MTKLAHYEVLNVLGAGGMGEVHRARDTKLGREVALKILPEDFAKDPERLARFRREARVLASLHHPNIASIFGLEESDGKVFLAMELAEGADLTQRIFDGPVPEEEVLDIAAQLAAGLEEAHENGVIHRDLKPANIKLGSDGKVKILDFGLARAFAGESSAEEELENSPTITAAMSREGQILGTAAYMSPEQARGRKVDRRSDIWAFGVVLFEMLSGKRMFDADTISDTLAAVLRDEIKWQDLPENISPGVRMLLERCLERDPMRRLRDIGEARIFLQEGAKDSSILASQSMMAHRGDLATPKGGLGLPTWMLAATGVVLLGVGALLGWKVLAQPEPPQLFNTALPKPPSGVFHILSTQPGPATISPNGTMVTYATRDESGTVQLSLRRLDSPEATTISGTEGAAYPFWSPDSRYIGFMSQDKLKKVAVSGGPPVTLCNAPNLKGGSWNEEGVIVFAPSHDSGIQRVPASGGEPVDITTRDTENGQNSHRHPRFLPGGEKFLFLARMNGNTENQVMVGSLDGSEPVLLTTSETAAEYSKGHLLTVREGILLATPFNPKTLELGENSTPLVEDILVVSSGAACGIYSPTLDGKLVYQTSTGTTERALEWLGPPGSITGQVGEPGELFRPRVSPDGTQAVVEILDADRDTNDLWLVDLETGLRSRFTFDAGDEYNALWSRDGTHIFYTAGQDSTFQIMMQPVEGTGSAQVLSEGNSDIEITDTFPDGSRLFYDQQNGESSWDVYVMDLDTGESEMIHGGELVQGNAKVSPDGRWLAYHTQTDASWEVIVCPVSGGNRRWQIDKAGGVYPFWSPDGNTLYFIEFSGDIMAVPVDGSGSTFRAGAMQVYARAAPPQGGGIHVSLHPEGERILHVSGEISEDETGHLRLVTDWQRGLTK